MAQVERVKCVAVGDGAIGKTSLLIAFTEKRFPEDYVPTVFENYITTIDIDGKEVSVSLWDTAGQEELASLRSLSYPDTDIFLLCFSLVDETSLRSAEEKWYPEITEKCAEAKIFVVGTKSDLLQGGNNNNEGVPTREMIDRVVRKIGAVGYKSCSAKMQEGIGEVFDEAIRQALFARVKSKPRPESPRKKSHHHKHKHKDKDGNPPSSSSSSSSSASASNGAKKNSSPPPPSSSSSSSSSPAAPSSSSSSSSAEAKHHSQTTSDADSSPKKKRGICLLC